MNETKALLRMNIPEYARFEQRISDLHQFDSHKKIYSADLYTVYLMKPWFLSRVKQLNPFNSEKLIWIDFGVIRDKGGVPASDFYNKTWPGHEQQRTLLAPNEDRATFGGVGGTLYPTESFCKFRRILGDGQSTAVEKATTLGFDYEKNARENMCTFMSIYRNNTQRNWLIAGALIGTSLSGIDKWSKVYYDYLDQVLDCDAKIHGMTLMDQHIMGSLACFRPDLVEVVDPPKFCCHKQIFRVWSFLLLYWSSTPLPSEP